MPYYKVLSATGTPLYGGLGSWPLPSPSSPGDWRTHDGPLVLCSSGLHLTSEPARWMTKKEDRVFLAEYKGEMINGDDDKIVVRKARLVREIIGAELAKVNIFIDGKHGVKSGFVWASGSATVSASGSATVRAWGNAKVKASGSATVRAWESASVMAWGSATVEAWGSATVRAWESASVEAMESATVEAWGSAKVMASENATVWATGSAKVEASENATVISPNGRWFGNLKVTVKNRAVWVDQRGAKPKIISACEIETEKQKETT